MQKPIKKNLINDQKTKNLKNYANQGNSLYLNLDEIFIANLEY